MTYTVEVAKKAAKQLRKLTPDAQRVVLSLLDGLAENPRPHGCKKMQGTQRPRFRVRRGNFRVIYEVHDDQLLVLVLVLGDRKGVYRNG